jgi:uncharacterized delta-60 repeat protein/uncharacterized repeat protein (TIGR01451 family)
MLAAGDLDPSFDGDGWATTGSLVSPFPGDVALATDRKILMSGSSRNGLPGGPDFTIARFLPTGGLDPDFGDAGVVIKDLRGVNEHAASIAAQDDGRIVAVGSARSSTGDLDFALARFDETGSLDPTFGTGGVVIDPLSVSNRDDKAGAVAILDDQRILVAGDANATFGGQIRVAFAVARYSDRGVRDGSFGTSGVAYADFGANSTGAGQGMAVADDDKIVVVGQIGFPLRIAIARFHSNGTPDTTFDGDGKLITTIPGTSGSTATDVVIQPDGKILILGTYQAPGVFGNILARYLDNGALDTSFDGDGILQIPAAFGTGLADLMLQNDGKILVVGTGAGAANSDFRLARYEANGAIDASFGSGGAVTADFGANDSVVAGVLQPDGKIVAAGVSADRFAVARFIGSPPLGADVWPAVDDMPDPVPAGQNIVYNVTVNNDGPASASDVVVEIVLSLGASFVSAMPSRGTCAQTGGIITCELGTLAVDALATIDLVVTPAAIGYVTTEARVATTSVDPDPTNNSAHATSRVLSHFSACNNTLVTGDRAGEGGTTHPAAYDGNLGTFFNSTHDDWQYVQIDFGCVGDLSAVRRYMSRDGVDTSGARVLQGEGVSYSIDGGNWTNVTGPTSTGWHNYVNYGAQQQAWHTVNYGWSEWLRLNEPVLARYVRFNWDDNHDALHDVEIALAEPSAAATVTVPKWIEAPTLDGDCSDMAYSEARAGEVPLMTPSGSTHSRVKLLHDSHELFACVAELPTADPEGLSVRDVSILVDSDHSGDSTPVAGDYRFSIAPDGSVLVEQGDGAGGFAPFVIPLGDFAAVTRSPAAGLWTAEARIDLEWLAGYARIDGLHLALNTVDGAALRAWPNTASAAMPSTWGDVALAPIYGDDLTAGSAFVDGEGGYLVVPFSPALNPASLRLTIEAWVRAADADCGTLVGNGQDMSYWLGLCRVAQFSHRSAGTVISGQTPLGDDWHHVAVSINDEGVRRLYVDGQLQIQPGWEIAEEREESLEELPKLGLSDRMLRIGSDRDAALGGLHGYIHELRIWDRRLSDDEIRQNAFIHLTGDEPGLVGLWPFTDSLQDLARGRHAGRIGNASLAREVPDVTSFPPLPVFPEYDYPTPPPINAWSASLPYSASLATIDGVCGLTEYLQGTEVLLEPRRQTSMRLLLADSGLAFCTNVLLGRDDPNEENEVILLIDRSGQGGANPGADHLRLRLFPDGTVKTEQGVAGDFSQVDVPGLVSRRIASSRFAFQEDSHHYDVDWWSTELLLPWSALSPFEAGDTLRFALDYKGTVPGNFMPEIGGDRMIAAQWPVAFDGFVPETWGSVATQPAPGGASPRPAGSPDERTPISTATATHSTRSAPSEDDFDEACPTWEPNPFDPSTWDDWWQNIQYVTDPDDKWPQVDDSRPVVQVDGTLHKVYVSAVDSPAIHDSHDLDMNLTIRDPAMYWMSLHTDEHGNRFSGGPNLKLETESARFPPYVGRDTPNARPSIGDHVTVAGRWIFDCGHEPKTEIHPIPFMESDRLEARPLWPGGPLQTVRVARVWLQSDPGGFAYTFDGPFEFDVAYPDPATELSATPAWNRFVRVVEGGTYVQWQDMGDHAHVVVTPPRSTGEFYFELMLGYLLFPTDPVSDGADIYTIDFTSLEVLDDHDAGPPDCVLAGGELVSDCGEWYFAVNVNGNWRQLLWNHAVEDGETVDLSATSPYHVAPLVLSGNIMKFQTTAYEEDSLADSIVDPDGDPLTPGAENLNSDRYDRGTLSNQVGAQVLDYEFGADADWRLHYTVTPGGDLPSILVDQSYWQPRLAEEPNDRVPTELGEMAVPPASSTETWTTTHTGYITRYPLQQSSTTVGRIDVLDDDIDRYRFTFDDLADVSILASSVNTPFVQVDIDHFSPFYHTLPNTLIDGAGNLLARDVFFGYRGVTVSVSSNSTAVGDAMYNLYVNRRYKELPEDWGEDEDAIADPPPGAGRIVDLDPSNGTQTPTPPGPELDHSHDHDLDDSDELLPDRHTRDMNWAWQHVAGDVDYYDVEFPPASATGPPPPQPGDLPCRFNADADLLITAFGAELTPVTDAPFTYLSGGSLSFINLSQSFPGGGTIRVEVRNGNPAKRDLYQFSAQWTDSKYYSAADCEALRQDMLNIQSLFPGRQEELYKGIIAISHFEEGGFTFPPRPLPDPIELRDGGTILPVVFDGLPDSIILSSPIDQPVSGRLFNRDGILISESFRLRDDLHSRTVAPGGMNASAEIIVRGRMFEPPPSSPSGSPSVGSLSSPNIHFLQIIPEFEIPPGGAVTTTVGVNNVGTEVDLEIAVAQNVDPVMAGEPVVYTLTVTNHGPSFASQVVVENFLPTGTMFESATTSRGVCNHAAGVVKCNLFLSDDETATIVITVIPTTLGALVNRATVTSPVLDRRTSNNEAVSKSSVGPPRVAGAFVAGGDWTASFTDFAGGIGYPLATDTAMAGPLPWVGLNRIRVQFNQDVAVAQGDLALSGVSEPTYNIADGQFTYDPATFVATWTLADPIKGDKLQLKLADTIENARGERLGPATVRFDVLPGDFNRDGQVNRADLVSNLPHQFHGTGAAAYDVLGDLDGDGAATALDWMIARDRFGHMLPAGEPSSPSPAAPSPRLTALPVAVIDVATPSQGPRAGSRSRSVLSVTREIQQRAYAAATDRLFADTSSDLSTSSATRRILRASRRPRHLGGVDLILPTN